jgi:hypothetical protein
VSLNIKFRPNYEPYAQDMATLLDTQWGQLGIHVTLTSLPDQVLRAMANNASGWQVITTSVLGPQTNLGVTPGPTVKSDLGADYVINAAGQHVSWNSTYQTVISRMQTEAPGSSAFNADARTAAEMLVQGVPAIPMFILDNWGVVRNDFNWGNSNAQTGIYQTQAITQFQTWPLTLDEITPLSTSSSTTSSTTGSSTATTTTTSSSSGSSLALSPAIVGTVALVAVLTTSALLVGGARRPRHYPVS